MFYLASDEQDFYIKYCFSFPLVPVGCNRKHGLLAWAGTPSQWVLAWAGTQSMTVLSYKWFSVLSPDQSFGIVTRFMLIQIEFVTGFFVFLVSSRQYWDQRKMEILENVCLLGLKSSCPFNLSARDLVEGGLYLSWLHTSDLWPLTEGFKGLESWNDDFFSS